MKANPHFTISFYILKVWILIYIPSILWGDVLDCLEKINLNSKCCRPVPGCASFTFYICVYKRLLHYTMYSCHMSGGQCCRYQYLKYQSQSAMFVLVLLGGRTMVGPQSCQSNIISHAFRITDIMEFYKVFYINRFQV